MFFLLYAKKKPMTYLTVMGIKIFLTTLLDGFHLAFKAHDLTPIPMGKTYEVPHPYGFRHEFL
jgi:hypothetical protein